MLTSFMEIVDEVLAEDLEILGELYNEEIKPIVDYRKEQEKKRFEVLYKEVLKLEKEV